MQSMVAKSPEHAVELLDQAFSAGDLEKVLSFYEDAAVVVTEPGKTARGVSELRSFFERVIRSGGSAKQLKTEVLEADGIALFISRWNFQVPNADSEAVRRTFVATTVFRKQPDGEWKILIDNPFGPLILGAE
jgi:uncharacterized protein (TIGR02246 family)